MRRLRVGLAVAAAVVLVAAVVVAAWASRADLFDRGGAATAHPDTEPIPTAHIGGSEPGDLVSAATMPGLSHSKVGSEFNAARVVYHSTNGDTGEPTVVSGSVYTPKGAAPQGGWPVVAFGHGTTGIDEPCAPSLSDSLLGMSSMVVGLVRKGYAVAFADYQGLGAPGVHPYLDAKTAGLNVIDSVRALHHTFDDISPKWAALGGSQGGGAVWAAGEQAGGYAPELDLVGVVAMVPAADVTGLVDKAQAETLTYYQRPAFQSVVETLARLHPDLNRDDYRRGAAAEYWEVLSSCSGAKGLDRKEAAEALAPGDLAPKTPQAAERLRGLLRGWALPQQPLTAPLSVSYGGQDEYIDAQWTTDAIARACALGGPVVWDLQPQAGHGNVDISSRYAWLADRFAGKPVADECTSAAPGN
ncbi:lipase family protein [Mycolicibacterium holsaticum]|uniref:lipase family protein n=1 Tax=Mycolicibacterium holsaticum TaxID=152142 RepID=UPI001C7CC79E|nr:lipase family protein [Mycolicibacterium holsaticum]QZA11379.1 lipase family protein [Mycolicibacterium holsaticum DSM 44478 = JCM 12374]UNC11129.1 alpha/beta hydrolase [Mycolicibacterium holsaticum DSM 44478 = JCM 12374]